jgi:hypothetical protein
MITDDEFAHTGVPLKPEATDLIADASLDPITQFGGGGFLHSVVETYARHGGGWKRRDS